MSNLLSQRRMAMSIFGVGFRKVWLDPSKLGEIKKATTREHIRDLIGQDIIQVIETHRGKRNKLTQIYQANNQTLQRIKKNYQAKVTLRQELAGNKATSLGNAPIDEAKTESL